ncbi:MAG TPA: cell division protein FtsK, partial [Cryomorphaceae bacterium]|nr:cell division protein FtsK [Cryomorphaceae bacterium]
MAKQKVKAKKNSGPSALKQVLSNKTNHTVLGILLVFLAVFMAGAFTSYFFSWQQDQSRVSDSFFALLANPDFQVQNALGKVGAAL